MSQLMKCPKCDSNDKQQKIGKTDAGSQRYKCSACHYRYTPIKKPRGYNTEVRQKAIGLFLTGFGPRQISRQLQIHHTTVSNWIKSYKCNLPN